MGDLDKQGDSEGGRDRPVLSEGQAQSIVTVYRRGVLTWEGGCQRHQWNFWKDLGDDGGQFSGRKGKKNLLSTRNGTCITENLLDKKSSGRDQEDVRESGSPVAFRRQALSSRNNEKGSAVPAHKPIARRLF